MFYFATQSNFYDINKINVDYISSNIYTDFSEDSIVKKVHNMLNNKKQSVQDINTSLLEDLILKDKYIKKAEVYLTPGEQINIFIDFRKPFVRLLRNQNLYYYDDELKLIANKIENATDLLIISGEINKKTTHNLVHLVNDIYNHKMLNNVIGGIHYNSQEGYVLSSKICDLKINIGFNLMSEEIIKKIQLFGLFLDLENYCGYCDTVNLEYANQLICVQ